MTGTINANGEPSMMIANAAFEEVGGDDVRPFSRNDLGKRRVGVVFDQLLDHRSVDDAIDVDAADAPFHLTDDGIRRESSNVADRDVGSRDSADPERLDFELGCAQTPTNERRVGA